MVIQDGDNRGIGFCIRVDHARGRRHNSPLPSSPPEANVLTVLTLKFPSRSGNQPGAWLLCGLLGFCLVGCGEVAQAPPKSDGSVATGPASPKRPEGSPSAAVPSHSKNGSAPGSESSIRFADMTAESGIDFVHESGDFEEKPFPAANGSGVAAFDFDLDGWVDLYFLTGSRGTFDADWKARPRNRCYRNLGDWKFREVTDATGLGWQGFSAGVSVADVNSDGFPDVFVNCYGSDRLYLNQGDGTFFDASQQSGVANDTLWGTSAAFLDYDNDGLLDLYVANYATWSMETNKYCGDRQRGVRTFCGPTTVDPAPHVLYHNEGDGRFRVSTAETGLDRRPGRGQGVVATDLNLDGWTDLYVANDMNPNSLYINTGTGTFRDASEESGTDVDYRGSSQAGMGIAVADVNQDGLLDLFVTNYEGEHNAYYESRGLLIYQDVSRSRGLAADSIPWVGWGTALEDFDGDGWVDCVVTNGHTDNNFQEMGRDSPYQQKPAVWRNVAGRFQHVSGVQIGEYFASPHVGRGLAVADFDGDDRPDLVVVHQDAPPALLKNLSAGPAPVTVRLVGVAGNRDAIGATLWVGQNPARLFPVPSGGSYASEHQRVVRIPESLASRLSSEGLSIRWPGGSERVNSTRQMGRLLFAHEHQQNN